MVKFNLKVAEFRRRYLGKHGIAEAVTLAVITAMIGWFNHFMRIDMTESMEILFRECDGASDYDHLCQYVCHSLGAHGRLILWPEQRISGPWSTPSSSLPLRGWAWLLSRTDVKCLRVSSCLPWPLARRSDGWWASWSKRSTGELRLHSITFEILTGHSAYPTSGIFSVCQPDVPCITPGTYALLGAAAALR